MPERRMALGQPLDIGLQAIPRQKASWETRTARRSAPLDHRYAQPYYVLAKVVVDHAFAVAAEKLQLAV